MVKGLEGKTSGEWLCMFGLFNLESSKQKDDFRAVHNFLKRAV